MKEKAKELIGKFTRIEDDTTFYWEPYYDKNYTDEEIFLHAKKCSLIVVDEMLKCDSDIVNWELHERYWNEVKQEIENL